MPADIEGQRKQRFTEIQGRASKKQKQTERRRQLQAERKAEKDALKEGERQKKATEKANKKARKTGGAATVRKSHSEQLLGLELTS